MTEIERALEWFANMARDESAKACATAASAELAEKDAQIDRRNRLLRRARGDLLSWVTAFPNLDIPHSRSLVAMIDMELLNDDDPAPRE
jgi:hypothetical protein